MKRVIAVVMLVGMSMLSAACYVKQDEGGQWWACDTVQTPNGPSEACYALPSSPF